MFGMMRGIRNGETRRTLCAARFKYISSTLEIPPIPTPTMTPVRSGAASGSGRPASSTASSAAPTVYWMKMSIFFKSLRSMKRSGSKSRTSPATRAGRAEASKRVIGPMPERPATRLSQFASIPMPSGVTRPRPVTTTRRRVPFHALKARNASAARAGVKVASHVRPVIARSRDERPPRFVTLACGALLLVAGCPSRPATAVSALELHRRAIVIDTHSDCTQRIAYDGIDFARTQPDMHVDLPKMRAGGLDAQFFSVFVGPWQAKPEAYYAEAMKQFDAVHAMIQAHPETIAWARTAAEIRANAEHKRISALFGVEGGHALLPGGATEMLEHLRTFYARGARYLTLTWSIASPLGGSSGDDSDGQGLTDVGRRIIDEMARLGTMAGVSPVSHPPIRVVL